MSYMRWDERRDAMKYVIEHEDGSVWNVLDPFGDVRPYVEAEN